ncbi:hemolin-like [Haliotis rufescens]|uniref:hemolin-like n=1 Tax=Haliotis rufescens TaxID=6454 RepID=UPI00201F5443|nr:hemolin-like [Haliotis rufescens]
MYHVWCCLLCVWITTRASTAVGAYARLGEPVTVTWAMSPIKEFKVMKDYRVLFQITGSNKVTVADKELRTRINGDSLSYTRGTFSFQLYNVTPSDAGQYSCYLDPTRPPYRRTRMPNCGQTLYVIGFEDISIQAEEVENSGPVHLTCICRLRIYPDSVPTVSITWKENDVRLYSGGRNHMASSETWSYGYDERQINHTSTLTIRDGWRENDRYKCQAGVGEIQSESSEEIVLINWSDDNKNYTVVPEGEDAMMTWKMPSLESGAYITSPSGPHLMRKQSDKWNVGYTFTSRLQIKGVSHSSEFVIARLLLYNVTAADAGKYFCVSGYRRVPQCGHTLIVSRKPEKTHITATELTVVGENLTLSCSTTSRSLPRDHTLTMSYIWRRDNARLLSGGRHQVSGSTLKIADVREGDSGNYSCQGTEEGGQVSGRSSIFVLIVRQLSAAISPAMYIIIGCSTVVIIVVALVVVALLLRRKTNRASSDVTWSRWDGLRHSSYEDVQMNRTLEDEEQHFSNDLYEDVQLVDETQHLNNDVDEDIQLAEETQHLNNDVDEDIQLADETQHLHNDVDEDTQLADETQHLNTDLYEDIHLADETQQLNNDLYEDVQLADGTQHLNNDVDEDIQLADETQHLNNDVDEDIQLADKTKHLNNDVYEDVIVQGEFDGDNV